MEVVALGVAAVGAVVVGVFRGWRAFFGYLGGSLAAIAVVAVAYVWVDPCIPLCVRAEQNGRTLASAVQLVATIFWIGACLAAKPLSERFGERRRAPFRSLALAALIVAAAGAEASVDVVTCSC